jgi:hypothetical protein
METIQLYNGKQFDKELSYIMTLNENDNKYNTLNYYLIQKLNEGMTQNKLIYTQEIRDIGKTHALVQFAKLHGFTAIVTKECNAKLLREKYHYSRINGADSYIPIRSDIVIDEGIDGEKLSKEILCTVMTGFSTKQ